MSNNIFLCACYIPPYDSPYFNPEIFTTLENDINFFQTIGSTILAGDFNARTGINKDFIDAETSKYITGDDIHLHNNVPLRKNLDNYVNNHGKLLLEICKSLDSRILNGRLRGDSFGRITFHGYRGISTVDYVIVSHELFDKFDSFTVQQSTLFSDHAQLTCKLTDELFMNKISNATKLFNLPKPFSWNSDSNDKFISSLQSNQVKSLLIDFELTSFECNKLGVNKAVTMFNNIIETAAKTSLQITRPKNRKSKISKVWFDNDCKILRKQLKKTANRLHKNPVDISIRSEYHTITKQYKHLLKYKKKMFDNKIVESLIKEKNTKRFWSTLKSTSNTNTVNEQTIPVDNLFDHFKTLHSNIDENNHTPSQKSIVEQVNVYQSNQNNNLNIPIKEIEIKKAIKNLKNQKSAGNDRIRNEMHKCGENLIISPLTKLFNIILETGIYPDLWTKGLITPIYKSGDKSDPSNYRGICVTSCLGKLFCSILNIRLLEFVQTRNILHPSQIGFLPGN